MVASEIGRFFRVHSCFWLAASLPYYMSARALETSDIAGYLWVHSFFWVAVFLPLTCLRGRRCCVWSSVVCDVFWFLCWFICWSSRDVFDPAVRTRVVKAGNCCFTLHFQQLRIGGDRMTTNSTVQGIHMHPLGPVGSSGFRVCFV